jgi:chorismate mutase
VTLDQRLADLRRRIDQLDESLVRLLNARSACALEIGALKHQAGLPIYQPDREQEVLRQVRAANPGPLDDAAVTRLFERIIDEARRLEREAAGGGRIPEIIPPSSETGGPGGDGTGAGQD